MNSISRYQTRFGPPIKTETSTPTQGLNEFLSGKLPPNWLGPVTVTARVLPEDSNLPWSECQFLLDNEEDGTPTTTAVQLLRPYLTASFLLVRGLTTRLNMSSTSRLRYQWEVRNSSPSVSGEKDQLTLRASTGTSSNALSMKVVKADGR
jgi:hypothetical protein